MHILLQTVVVLLLVILSNPFAVGADFVMIGTVRTGHDECDGEIKMENAILWNDLTAMYRHNVPHREYRGVEGKTVTSSISWIQ